MKTCMRKAARRSSMMSQREMILHCSYEIGRSSKHLQGFTSQ